MNLKTANKQPKHDFVSGPMFSLNSEKLEKPEVNFGRLECEFGPFFDKSLRRRRRRVRRSYFKNRQLHINNKSNTWLIV